MYQKYRTQTGDIVKRELLPSRKLEQKEPVEQEQGWLKWLQERIADPVEEKGIDRVREVYQTK